MSPRCDVGGLGFIEGEGRRVGIVGLRVAMAEVAELGLTEPKAVGEAVLAQGEKLNWIPPERRAVYGRALREAYDAVRHRG